MSARPLEELRAGLRRIDGRGYKAYRDVEGSYAGDGFVLHLDHAQGDPFAPPSRVRVTLPPAVSGLPAEAVENRVRRVAVADYLLRRLRAAVAAARRDRPAGMGTSGLVAVARPGQEVLERTAVAVRPDGTVEARLGVGLPARGRTVLGRQAEELLCSVLPALARAALVHPPPDGEELRRWWRAVEDQASLRERLAGLGLVAFVADGAVLPRESGAGDRPLRGPGVVPFRAPEGLAVTVRLPHAGEVRGLGVPAGVTLITGGGYHGKSTLLRALERGVYDHIPGDGRERVVTVAGAVKIRAEDGRRIEKVDISAFIGRLPGGQDTRRFSSENASGSTSQAANIVEALEAGATCLLVDEDTSATNFMIRDRRMQALIPGDREPITPFIDRVRQLHRERGVSSVIVVGGSGDYLDVADTVILMDAYRPQDATAAARAVAARYPTGREVGAPGGLPETPGRVPLPGSVDPRRGGRERVRVRDLDEIAFGGEEIELGAVEQLVDEGQTRAIAALLRYTAARYLDGRRTLAEVLRAVFADVDARGLEVLAPDPARPAGDLARPRLLEAAAALNRLRSLRVR